jgi:hypothetical protein
MDYTYNKEMENQKGGFLHALEILEAIKISNQNTEEVFFILLIFIEI